MRKLFGALLYLAVVFGGLFLPESVWAIQNHAAPEGLYIHQIGHILFALAMLGFAFRIRNSRLRREKSWQLMAVGSALLGLWNGWAFAGHFLRVENVWIQDKFAAYPGLHVLAYYAQMDHLLCVPALFCIYLALKKMTLEFRKRHKHETKRS